jgi:hypothetical protein
MRLLFMAALVFAGTSVSFFKYERALQAVNSAGQHYLVADDTLWEHARTDLSDVRLYAGEREISYAMEVERGGTEAEPRSIQVLEQGTLRGETQFLLDMSGIAEYDRVALRLAAKNFVAHARVSGQDDPHAGRWVLLGTTTLYDLSDEKLGHNSTLQIPLSAYKFLQVTMDSAVKPADVLGATAGIRRPQEALWRTVGGSGRLAQRGKETVVTFTVPDNTPIERIVFEIGTGQPNFRRDLEIEGGQGESSGSGEISRIHMQRGGQKIDVEQTSADIRRKGQGTLKAVIHNGDDPPLAIKSARLEQWQRRMYFDAEPGVALTLYYGDAQLRAPVYDYAKLFQKDAGARPIELSAESANAAYTGRPDERPWSERHPAVLWAAIIASVLILGGVALQSIRAAAA